jgi:3-hydroxybutyryl-CoA dehydrogenase
LYWWRSRYGNGCGELQIINLYKFKEDVMEIKKIGVAGAGMMGAEIGLCFAKCDYDVILVDRTKELADRGKEKQASAIDRMIKKGKFDENKKEDVLNRVTASGNYSDMADCDLVIEAVYESFEMKTSVYKELDKICKKECIFATNTSSISITKLASSVSRERAKNFVGTHFFSPASIMKLVEVIPGQLTEKETVETVRSILVEVGKETIDSKDVTGFVVNRLFHVYTAEACRLLEEGVCSVEDIDKACVLGLGYPVGPFRLLDNMGHDLNISVDKVLYEAYGERFRPSQIMQRLVDAGLFGKKSGEGFYNYMDK